MRNTDTTNDNEEEDNEKLNNESKAENESNNGLDETRFPKIKDRIHSYIIVLRAPSTQ